ncbi:MAG: transglutaminase family protein [Thainema sp.]
MRLNAGCELIYEADAPTPVILMLRPRSGQGQWVVREEYDLQPMVFVEEYTDSYGNLCQRLVVPEGEFRIHTEAYVETSDRIDVDRTAPFIEVQNLPTGLLQYLLPSRYCLPEQVGDLALEITAEAQPGYAQVEAIRQWIQTNIEYQYGTSDTSTTVLDTVEQRVGVCRDFTHLGISLCRNLSIPARMVVGYLHELEPMDLHAWFEAYVGHRWYTFDATQKDPKGNRIAIAYGRDAADVALATQFGPLTLKNMTVWVNAAEKAS